MENASKALLIAAAILIVIVLIGFGVSVLNSSADVQGQAEGVGTKLEEQTTQAAGKAESILGNISL